MSTNYFVKIYYSKTEDVDPEIRRFSIDVSAERSPYRELKEKLASLYPEQDMNSLTLQYIDDEAERVTFTTDEELRAAIEINKGANNLKIYAIPRSVARKTTTIVEEHSTMSDESPDEIPEEIHLDCLNNGHSHIRQTKTNSTATTTHSHGSLHSTPPHNNHLHHHHQHHRKQLFRAHKSHHRRPGPPGFVPPSHFLHHVQAQIPQWLPSREQTEHIRGHIKEHLNTLKTNTQTCVQNSKEYLENVGQYLQQALSPLGIDCDYRVDDKTGSTTTETATNTVTTNQTSESSTMETSSSNSDTPIQTEIGQATGASDQQKIEGNVEFCLAKLKAMGFNDNEALNELVRSKNGDINAVLDAINPRRS